MLDWLLLSKSQAAEWLGVSVGNDRTPVAAGRLPQVHIERLGIAELLPTTDVASDDGFAFRVVPPTGTQYAARSRRADSAPLRPLAPDVAAALRPDPTKIGKRGRPDSH
jgi:hypothetical protein